MILNRRGLLSGAGGAAALAFPGGCAPSANPTPDPSPSTSTTAPAIAGSVDVHCHVFNAEDVPIRNFVELCYLDKHPGGPLLDPTLAFICFIMEFETPTTEEELAELRGAAALPRALVRRGALGRKRRAVAHAAWNMDRGNAQYDHVAPDQQQPERRRVRRPALLPIQGFNPANRTWIHERLSRPLQRRLLLNRSRGQQHPDYLAVARELSLQLDLRTWIDFAYNYTKSRWELVDQLSTLSPLQSQEVFLYTPSLLDIGHFVGDLGTSPIAPQVEIMALIAARPGNPYAVHALVPFDPWRSIDGPAALDIVSDAILHKGCVGVKVYPPMGFKPIANDVANFPKWRRPMHPDGARQVDQQMKALLRFCLQYDVPILAHCSFSQFVTEAGGYCAAPEHWQAFMDAAPPNRNLRLNLAHLGGPWDLEFGWSKQVAGMLDGRYPNLYSDLADASFVLQADPTKSAANEKVMKYLAETVLPVGSPARARIMYGSDWSLLAREEGFGTYYGEVKTCLSDRLHLTIDERRGFMGRNALRFLGLARRPDGTAPLARQRLEEFRRSRGLPPALFERIDAVSVCPRDEVYDGRTLPVSSSGRPSRSGLG